MTGLIDRLLGRDANQSASVAKERLQLVLVHDRSNLSEEKITQLKDELIELISRYVEIDHEKVEIFVESENRTNWLVANIPLLHERKSRR